jgi:hypothetical protein
MAKKTKFVPPTAEEQGLSEELQKALIAKARDIYQTNDCEIDAVALFSNAQPAGCWVSAWVWVSAEELPLLAQKEQEDCNQCQESDTR